MTQGIVTVTRGGKVRLKIVVGGGGMNAGAVANAIRQIARIPTLGEAYELALRCEFGFEDSLVVMDETGAFHKTGYDLGPRYRQTFDQPHFNPRWAIGTAEHVEVVEV